MERRVNVNINRFEALREASLRQFVVVGEQRYPIGQFGTNDIPALSEELARRVGELVNN